MQANQSTVSLFGAVMSWFGVTFTGGWYAVLQGIFMGSLFVVAFVARALGAGPAVVVNHVGAN
jgi:hypothetical protein